MLLGLQDVVFELGARVLLDGVRWQIQPGERIGLIGENGAGKSTLLKLLSGQYRPTSGYIEKGSQVKIGFLHQDLLGFETQGSILDIVLQGRPELYQMQRRLDFLTHKMTDSAEEQVFLEEYMRLLSSFEEMGGYEITHRAERILEGLGFEKALHSRAYEQFSGGWRMRVLLAQMIFQNPDILLLDEPTNHLDLPSIEWLEKYLQQYKGSVVIVSHDRFFLDKAVQKIVALAYKKLHFYSGNYSFYEKELALREGLQQKAFDNQQNYIRQQERFIERFKAKASKATQAQSALKRLEKLERVAAVQSKGAAMHLRFQMARQPGKMIAAIRDFSKSYGEKLLFQNLNADIMRGDKIALIGANGSGKSTLLRMITQAVSFQGTLQYGHNVQYAFYAQHQLDALEADRTIFEEVLYHSSAHTTTQEIRTALGCFLFSGEDIDKKIKVLSGGERARVALCKMMLEKANFLILDEPTNHLDLRAINVVITALQQYEGTVLLVSHDRHFIAQTANKIWLMQRQRIEEFLGNYEAFQLARASKTSAPPTSERAPEKKKKEKIAPSSALKKEKELLLIEQKLAVLKQRQAQVEKHLCDETVLSDMGRYEAIHRDYAALEAETAQWEARYNRIFSELFD